MCMYHQIIYGSVDVFCIFLKEEQQLPSCPDQSLTFAGKTVETLPLGLFHLLKKLSQVAAAAPCFKTGDVSVRHPNPRFCTVPFGLGVSIPLCLERFQGFGSQ